MGLGLSHSSLPWNSRRGLFKSNWGFEYDLCASYVPTILILNSDIGEALQAHGH